MVLGISLAAIIVGAGLFFIEEWAFDDETLDIAYRRRLGIGYLGAGIAMLGVVGVLVQ